MKCFFNWDEKKLFWRATGTASQKKQKKQAERRSYRRTELRQMQLGDRNAAKREPGEGPLCARCYWLGKGGGRGFEERREALRAPRRSTDVGGRAGNAKVNKQREAALEARLESTVTPGSFTKHRKEPSQLNKGDLKVCKCAIALSRGRKGRN